MNCLPCGPVCAENGMRVREKGGLGQQQTHRQVGGNSFLHYFSILECSLILGHHSFRSLHSQTIINHEWSLSASTAETIGLAQNYMVLTNFCHKVFSLG